MKTEVLYSNSLSIVLVQNVIYLYIFLIILLSIQGASQCPQAREGPVEGPRATRCGSVCGALSPGGRDSP